MRNISEYYFLGITQLKKVTLNFFCYPPSYLSLKALGLLTPTPDFWAPVGEATSSMDAEDKINLLAHLVPRFGSGNLEQEEALESFVTGLNPTFAVIRAKCSDLSEADIQLVGSELLAAEILKPGRSTKSDFAAWISALTESEINDILIMRKSFKANSEKELGEMRTERAADEARLEATKKAMQEQVEKAREERTMAFNPNTGKMEKIEQKSK